MGYELTRLVELRDRTITSRTSIRSTGDHTLPVRWFAHPSGRIRPITLSLSAQVGMQDNPGFKLNDGLDLPAGGFRREKQGHYQPLQILRQEPLRSSKNILSAARR